MATAVLNFPAADARGERERSARGGVGTTLLACALFALAVAANIVLARTAGNLRLAGWIVTLLAVIGILGCIGKAINERPAGIVIDNRNRVSLSKLQATCWTVLILSGLASLIAARLHDPVTRPLALDMEIPTDLLIVMGISATSLVATPALLSLKTHAEPEQEEITAARAVGPVEWEGKVHGRPEPTQAWWSDIFRGDEVSNADSPDLGKVQQAFITALLLAFYGVQLGNQFIDGDLYGMPAIGEQMAWLLGISHAGYLGYKAAPHSRTKATTTAPAEVG